MPLRPLSLLPIALSALLAGCDSPSPEFRSKDTRTYEATVQGATFKIHRREDWVESYRVNFEALPSVSSVLRRAKIAIEQSTGCPIREGSLSGDQGIQRAQLNCNSDLPPVPPPIRVDLDCELQDEWSTDEDRVVMQNIECTPIAARQ
ncbi:hypothetical protein [Aliiroseovarius crassostreae]|uniref:hypothetical protein n=1 Tax=Aliiroseovarius crassostreae TaxID=154981 RepID=UPI0022008291|nr:hypothetical protein [Aliiroseovarius crassostreae]UWQ05031.1 hypothetical protein K3X22_00710 [Aliiroseovarius crassostreae]